jgi:hypothetical protein
MNNSMTNLRRMILAKFAMRPIAVGGIGGVFAVAEGYGFLFGEGKFHGCHAGAFVGSITVGLGLGHAAGAPPVVSSGEFEDGGFAIVNYFFHNALRVQVVVGFCKRIKLRQKSVFRVNQKTARVPSGALHSTLNKPRISEAI